MKRLLTTLLIGFLASATAWSQDRPTITKDRLFEPPVFVSNFSRGDSPFTEAPFAQSAKLKNANPAEENRFADKVAISGNTVAIGTPAEGAVYVFVRSHNGWIEQARLTASDGARIGLSVAIDGDTIVTGDISFSSYRGTAYVFTRTGTTWTEQQRLTASDGATSDHFGQAVAVKGDMVLVGAPWDNVHRGTVYAFRRTGSVWSELPRLVTSDNPADAHLGGNIAISGDTAVVGADRDVVGGVWGHGSAYIFVKTGDTWVQQSKIVVPDGLQGDAFGITVGIDGDTVVIGTSWSTLSALSRVYVFSRSGTIWKQQARLDNPTGNNQISFGSSVALAGNTIVIGAYTDDFAPLWYNGSAYVFTRSGSAWSYTSRLSGADSTFNAQFGYSAAMSDDTIIIGAPRGHVLQALSYAGSAFAFDRASASISMSGRIMGNNGRGVANARVSLHVTGPTRYAITNPFGYYRFANVTTGINYVVRVSSKRYKYAERIVTVNDNVTGVDFTPSQ